MTIALTAVLAFVTSVLPADWQKARDAQDRAALDRIAAAATQRAGQKQQDADAQYQAALAQSLRGEVAMELRDKAAAGAAAEEGIRLAERAVKLKPGSGEYHRLLGALCGQIIPANLMLALKYGRCAMDEVTKAVELEPKSSLAWMSHGVGNYYLPASFGGSPEKAVEDFRKAIALDAKNAEAHLWLGIALRKLNRNTDARAAIETSLKLNPTRVWTKQQLDKTPAK